MPTAREETTRLAELLKRERLAMADFLVALAAFDEARGWVELGYSSLFYFLLRELGLPKGPAYYRMTAAGLVRKYPELVEPLRDGRLHLTSVTQLARVITPENRAEVLPRFFHLSKREAREVVAELVPAAAPPLRTVVTAVRSAPTAPTPPSALQVLPEELPPAHPAAQTGNMGDISEVVPPLPRQQRAQVDPLTAEKSRLHVTVSRRLLEKLSRGKGRPVALPPRRVPRRPSSRSVSTSSCSATRSGGASGRSRVRRLRRRRTRHPRRRAAATSRPTSGGPSGSATAAAAPGPSRTVASAPPPTSSSWIT